MILKRRTVWILAVLLVLVYAGLVGVGAYLQYDAGRQFDQMMEDSAEGGLSPEDLERHQQTAQQSESLKKFGRMLGYFVPGFCLLVVGLVLVMGLLVILPWQLKSGDHAVNYYHEQYFVVLVGLIGCAIAGSVGLLREKKGGN